MNISRIEQIRHICRLFADRACQLGDVADALDEPLMKVHDLFLNNGIIGHDGNLQDEVDAQAVIETILLFYALKPYHAFMTTRYGPPTTDYRRKPAKVEVFRGKQ